MHKIFFWFCLNHLKKNKDIMVLSLKHLFSKCASINKDRCYEHISLSLRKDIQFTYSTKPPMYQMTVEVLTPKPAFQLSKTIDKVPVI